MILHQPPNRPISPAVPVVMPTTTDEYIQIWEYESENVTVKLTDLNYIPTKYSSSCTGEI